LFPRGKADMKFFRGKSTLINELHEGSFGRWHYQIRVLRKRSTKQNTH
jgi:hypothetical protein